MRLYVLYARPLGAAYAVQRTDLVEDHVLCFLRGNRHISASKAQPVRIARMCSDNHTVPGGKMHGAAYHRGIASMPAAGDIRRCHQREKLLVGAIGVGPKPLPQISVKIHKNIHPIYTPPWFCKAPLCPAHRRAGPPPGRRPGPGSRTLPPVARLGAR